MIRHVILAAAAAAGAMVPCAVDAVEPSNCTGIISFASEAEKNWVEAVYDHTDNLTCWQTRWIYRNKPGLRDEFPGNHIYNSWATPMASPASATATQHWCQITTVEKYRAPIFPFGDHVLFTMKMTQQFMYDGSRVATGTPVMDIDITTLGFRWDFDGITLAQDVYFDAVADNYQHQSDRFGRFSTEGFTKINLVAVRSTLHTMIWVQANGDWRTINTNGVAGCQNP